MGCVWGCWCPGSIDAPECGSGTQRCLSARACLQRQGPAALPWDELSLFLLHSDVPLSRAARPLTSLSLCLVAITFTAHVWHGSNLIPSALLCLPHTSSHRSAPVPLRVLLSPPCLLRASPTASAQPRWGRTARCCWHGSAHGLRTAWEGH